MNMLFTRYLACSLLILAITASAHAYTPHTGYQATDHWEVNSGNTRTIHIRFFDAYRGAKVHTITETKPASASFNSTTVWHFADGMVVVSLNIYRPTGVSDYNLYALNYDPRTGTWSQLKRTYDYQTGSLAPTYSNGIVAWRRLANTSVPTRKGEVFAATYDPLTSQWIHISRQFADPTSSIFVAMNNGVVVYRLSLPSTGLQEVGMYAYNPMVSEWHSKVFNQLDGVTSNTQIAAGPCNVTISAFGPSGSKTFGYEAKDYLWRESATHQPLAAFDAKLVSISGQPYTVATDLSQFSSQANYFDAAGTPLSGTGGNRSFYINHSQFSGDISEIFQEVTGCDNDDFATFTMDRVFSALSSRSKVLPTPTGMMVLGIQLEGTRKKRMGFWGLGQSTNVSGYLPNPKIILRHADGTFIAENESYGTLSASEKAELITVGFPAGAHSNEAALIWNLNPSSAYTIELVDSSGNPGVGLVAAYELSQDGYSRMVGLSARQFVGATDANAAYFAATVSGNEPKQIVATAWGDSLFQHIPTANGLPNPKIDLFDANIGSFVVANDNWTDFSPFGDLLSALTETGLLNNQGSLDPALLYTTLPGSVVLKTSGVGTVQEGAVLTHLWSAD